MYPFCGCLRSRAISKTLNPEWNQAFVLTVDDGLHRADFVKLVIKDDSRSGPDSVMGSGKIDMTVGTRLLVSLTALLPSYSVYPQRVVSVEASCHGRNFAHALSSSD